MSARSGPQLLVDRHFGPYLAGNALSSIGTWFQNLAASLLIYELTGSTLMVGVVNFAQFVGALVLAPVAGSAADRFDRRYVLMVSQAVAAAVAGALAVVTIAGHVTAPLLVASTALLGLALAFFAPSMLSLVPLLVPREDLDTALSINSASFNLARAVGPVLAAAAIARLGYGPAFAINATTFAVFVVLLVAVRPRPNVRAAPGSRPRLRDAVALVRETDAVVPLLVVVAVCSIAIDPVYTLTPELAIDVFGGDETTTGLLVGAFGTGAVLTAVFAASRLAKLRYILGASLTTIAVGHGPAGRGPEPGRGAGGAGDRRRGLPRHPDARHDADPEQRPGRAARSGDGPVVGVLHRVPALRGAGRRGGGRPVAPPRSRRGCWPSCRW